MIGSTSLRLYHDHLLVKKRTGVPTNGDGHWLLSAIGAAAASAAGAVVAWRLATHQPASLIALAVIALAAVAIRPIVVRRAGT